MKTFICKHLFHITCALIMYIHIMNYLCKLIAMMMIIEYVYLILKITRERSGVFYCTIVERIK